MKSFKIIHRITIWMVMLAIASQSLSAANAIPTYQILRLNTPTITVGGKALKVGDTFKGTSNIKWNDYNQLMEVMEVGKGEKYLFSKKVFESKGAVLSIADFMLRTNKASSRDTETPLKLHKSPVTDKFPEKRIALIIGNSNYTNLSFLRNAQKDASDVSNKLLNLGFDVIETYETNYTEMRTALNKLSGLGKDYDVVLFYFAGHGLQEAGKNYLLPINAELEYKSELERFLHGDDLIYSIAETKAPTQIVIIDACRNAKSTWSRSSNTGLARMEGGPGAVIVFSTESGKIALDGEGDNSPFAESLLRNLDIQRASLTETMNNVVRDTYEATEHQQYPLVVGMPLTDFTFIPKLQTPKTPSRPAVQNNSQDAASINKMGLKYLNGDGVEKNYAEALKCFEKAASQGYPSAFHNLGYMYLYGYGVTQDYTKAMEFYRKSAESGSGGSENQIGWMYYKGLGVPVNIPEALKWFQKGAQHGDRQAQNNLGFMYERGQGVQMNLDEALKWYERAAAKGNESAKKNLASLKEKMQKAGKNPTLRISVYEDDGEPMIGANIMLERQDGSLAGSASDLDGVAQISNVGKGDTLIISYVGYCTKSIKVKSDNLPGELKVRMKPSTRKDETVYEEI